MLFFDGADRDAEAVGDFLVGKQFNLAQQKHSAAAGRKLSDGIAEQTEFLAGHDLLNDARFSGRREIGCRCFPAERCGLAAAEPVDGEIAGGGVENGLRVFRGRFSRGRINAHVRIVSDVLSFVRVAEKTRQITPQRRERCAVQTGEIGWFRLVISHGD